MKISTLLTFLCIPIGIIAQINSGDQKAGLGEDAVFQSRFIQIIPNEWQWRFNGVRMIGATNGTLVVHNATYNDQGFYSVDATDGLRSVSSIPVYLFIISRPKLELTPSIKLEFAAASGRAYQLEVSSDLLVWADFGTRFVATNSPFSIFTEVDLRQAKFYRAREADTFYIAPDIKGRYFALFHTNGLREDFNVDSFGRVSGGFMKATHAYTFALTGSSIAALALLPDATGEHEEWIFNFTGDTSGTFSGNEFYGGENHAVSGRLDGPRITQEL